MPQDRAVSRRTPGRVSKALTVALGGLTTTVVDGAVVELAKVYAAAIDAPPCSCDRCPTGDLAKLGPQLLAVLESLGMTPRGRAAVLGKGGAPRDPAPRSALDEARARRARQHGAATVDSTAP